MLTTPPLASRRSRAEDETMADSSADPSWTDQNTHDPGITMLEVLSYGVAAATVTYMVVRRRAKKRRLGDE